MSKSLEGKYEPTQEEIRKAKETMTDEQASLSEGREIKSSKPPKAVIHERKISSFHGYNSIELDKIIIKDGRPYLEGFPGLHGTVPDHEVPRDTALDMINRREAVIEQRIQTLLEERDDLARVKNALLEHKE